jgi:hypothetical protein
MGSVQGEVLRHDVALTDEMVLLGGYRAEVGVDRAKDALQALAALGTGGMVDEVGRNEIIEHAVIAGLLSTEHLVDHVFRAAFSHGISVLSLWEGAREAAPEEQQSPADVRWHEAGLDGEAQVRRAGRHRDVGAPKIHRFGEP